MAGRSKVPPSSKAEEQDETGFILLDITPNQEHCYSVYGDLDWV